jgi:uncharacterized Zn-binding protein involved in type VI secretion
MGQPAARAGDPTAHGGVIVAGAPTVFIGKMPAARLGDTHVCPMVTPGTPPIPHVGMPIAKGSAGVNICGMPAARVGDMAPCVGPPDVIVMGCPTVNIGETKPGGGAGAGGPTTAATTGATVSAAIMGNAPQSEEDHFLHIEFKDNAGLPVSFGNYKLTYPNADAEQGTLPSKIKRGGVPQGQYEIKLKAITTARWSVREARDDDTVQCIVETVGIEDGTPAVLQIYMRNLNSPDRVVRTVDNLQINSGSLSYDWQPWFFDETDPSKMYPGFLAPSFFFKVIIVDLAERSGILTYRDYIEIRLREHDETPIPNAEYRLHLATGEIRTGNVDGQGNARIENIPPCKCKVEFPRMNET